MMLAEAAVAAGETAASDPTSLIVTAVICLVAALVVFFLELLIPSFGLLTILGIILTVGSLVSAFSAGQRIGVIFLVVVLILAPVVVYLAFKMFDRFGVVLKEGSATEGDSSAPEVPQVGGRGVAVTVLRPSGTAQIDGKKYSVVTQGDLIEAGVQVEVVSAGTVRVVVKPVKV